MNENTGRAVLNQAIELGLPALLIFATLTFGAVEPWSMTIFQVWAFALVSLWLARMALDGRCEFRTTPFDIPLLVVVGLFVLQLGIGHPLWWQRPLETAGFDRRLTGLGGTVYLRATRSAFLLLLSYVGVYYLVVHNFDTRGKLNRLLTTLLVFGGLLSFYGLLEFLSGNNGILGWKGGGAGRVRGTFVNPDHFGAYLAILILLSTGFLMALSEKRRRRRHGVRSAPGPDVGLDGALGTFPSPPNAMKASELDRHPPAMGAGASSAAGEGGGVHGGESPVPPGVAGQRGPDRRPEAGEAPTKTRAAQQSSPDTRRKEVPREALYVFATGIMGVGLTFTLSRAGLMGFLFALFLLFILLRLRNPEGGGHFRAAAVMCVAALFVVWIGIGPLLNRLAGAGDDLSTRFEIYKDSYGMVRDFLWLGSGFGTYGEIFPKYQSPLLPHNLRYVYAHNDILEFMVEGGILSVLALVLACLFLFRDLIYRPLLGSARDGQGVAAGDQTATPRPRHNPYNINLALGAATGLVAVLFHSLLDFSLRIPANAVLVSLTAGVLVVAISLRFHRESTEVLTRHFTVSLSARGRKIFLAAVVLGFAVATVAIVRPYMALRAADAAGYPLTYDWQELPTQRVFNSSPEAKRAVAGVADAVALDPRNAMTRAVLGMAYETLAMRAWNSGLSASGQLLDTVAERATEAKGLFEKAMEAYRKAVVLDPARAEYHQRLGWSSGSLGRILLVSGALPPAQGTRGGANDYFRVAVTHLRAAVALHPTNPRWSRTLGQFLVTWLKESGQLADTKLLVEAAHAYRRAVTAEPALLADALDHLLSATNDFRVLSEAIPADAPDFGFLAALLDRRDLRDQAQAAYERAIALAGDEDKPGYYRQYAGALSNHGDLAKAKRTLELAIRYSPGDPSLRLALGSILKRLNEDGAALKEYQEALGLASTRSAAQVPTPSEQRTNRGQPTPRDQVIRDLLIRAGLNDGSRAAAGKAVYLAALGAYYDDAGDHREAIRYWEEAVSLDPLDATIHFGLAKSYDAIGAWRAALDRYRRAIELDRRNVDYRLWLADRYYQNDLSYQAINLWQEVTARKPGYLPVHLRIAEAYVQLGDFRAAEREYERVLRMDPTNEKAKKGLALLRGRLGAY